MRPRLRALAVVFLGEALVGAPVAVAQVGLAAGGPRPFVRVEVLKPFPADPGPLQGSRLPTSVWDATVVWPIRESMSLYGGWGLSFASVPGYATNASTSNPRLGALLGGPSGMHGEVHVDLPLAQEIGADESATGLGLFGDYERIERFLPDAWSIGATFVPETDTENGSVVGARLGSTLLISTDTALDPELIGVWAVYGRVPAERWALHLELSGTAAITESVDFGQRAAFFGSVGVLWPRTRFAPEIFMRAPLDDPVQSVLRLIAGLRLRFGA